MTACQTRYAVNAPQPTASKTTTESRRLGALSKSPPSDAGSGHPNLNEQVYDSSLVSSMACLGATRPRNGPFMTGAEIPRRN
jgi:hypothetical protein